MNDTVGARDGAAAEVLGIAGSGTIATGLAAIASTKLDVVLWARSDRSAQRAGAAVVKACGKLEDLGADPTRVTIVSDVADLGLASFLVEAISEDRSQKAELLSRLSELLFTARDGRPAPVLATTTSSLSVIDLAGATGHSHRFVGLHVFNPVTKMELVEVIFPPEAGDDVRERTLALCELLGKTAVEVPDTPGFVVNRLLFPYLFDAARFMTESGLTAEAVDQCMTLGAGLPMGPLALLDFVGLDVAKAIGDSVGLQTPAVIDQLIEQGALGRKSGHGFYNYS
jgi:3-hydroxybutyryl-CoA dehydrogenase